jgi:hypothetical protein
MPGKSYAMFKFGDRLPEDEEEEELKRKERYSLFNSSPHRGLQARPSTKIPALSTLPATATPATTATWQARPIHRPPPPSHRPSSHIRPLPLSPSPPSSPHSRPFRPLKENLNYQEEEHLTNSISFTHQTEFPDVTAATMPPLPPSTAPVQQQYYPTRSSVEEKKNKTDQPKKYIKVLRKKRNKKRPVTNYDFGLSSALDALGMGGLFGTGSNVEYEEGEFQPHFVPSVPTASTPGVSTSTAVASGHDPQIIRPINQQRHTQQHIVPFPKEIPISPTAASFSASTSAQTPFIPYKRYPPPPRRSQTPSIVNDILLFTDKFNAAVFGSSQNSQSRRQKKHISLQQQNSQRQSSHYSPQYHYSSPVVATAAAASSAYSRSKRISGRNNGPLPENIEFGGFIPISAPYGSKRPRRGRRVQSNYLLPAVRTTSWPLL